MEDSSGHEERAFNDEIKPVLKRFLSMQSVDKVLFFDVSEYEDLFDYFMEAGTWDQAEQVLQMARKQHPEINSFNVREAQLLMVFGKANKAMSLLNQAEKIEPFSEDILLLKAQLYSQIRQHKKALQYFEKSLEHALENRIEILLDMAMEWYELQDFDKAIQLLKDLLKEAPDHEVALHEIAHCYEASGRTDLGIDFFNSFLSTHPFEAAGWFNLGEMYMRLEENKKALEAFDYATAVNEEYAHSYFNKGVIFANMEDYESALKCFTECSNYEGKNPLTLCYIGECHEKMEDYNQALSFYDKVIELDENWSDAWMGKSVVYEISGEYLKALKAINRALAILPEHVTYMVQTAKLHSKLNDVSSAIDFFEKAVQTGPDYSEVWIAYAEFMEENSSLVEAIHLMMEGLAYCEGEAEFYYRLSAFLLKSGNESEALLFLGEALLEDYDLHTLLFEYFPEAANNKNINHLIAIYNSSS